MKTRPHTFTSATLFVLVLSVCFFMVLKYILPERLFSEIRMQTDQIVVDDLLLNALRQLEKETESIAIAKTDSLIETTINFEKSLGVVFPDERYFNYTGKQYLLNFFEKLEALELQNCDKVRIAYYSDSMTDGDLIVQDLRFYLQSQFGGMGVGFVPITSESAQTRNSIAHNFSTNWASLSYLIENNSTAPYGVNGHSFFAKDTVQETWVGFKSTLYANLKQLPDANLFYGASSNLQARLLIKSERDTIFKKITPLEPLNVLSLQKGFRDQLHFSFLNARNIPFYGIAFETNKGIYVDNFSSRGNSGLPLTRLDVNLMKKFQNKRPYDLIILHFGANVLNYSVNQYNWYEKGMAQVVEHLNKCFPDCPVLIVSTADKASKTEGLMKTDPGVLPLLTAQKNYAIATQSGFFNLFEAMGGVNTMIDWVEGDPPLAAKDYTHFNYLGAKKIGSLIYDEIHVGYQQYKRLKKKHRMLHTVYPPKMNDTIGYEN